MISGMNTPMKYPRTSYWPSSPSIAPEDRVMDDPGALIGPEVVITEKLDGQCTLLHRGNAYPRSIAHPQRAPWLAMTRKYHAWKTASLDVLAYGEDIYGVHSIEYAPVTENRTLYLFALRRGDTFASYDDMTDLAARLKIPTAPLLWRGRLRSEREADRLIARLHAQPSALGTEREGVVIRTAGAFSAADFGSCVAKSVRKDHVQTDIHWTRNWRSCAILGRSS